MFRILLAAAAALSSSPAAAGNMLVDGKPWEEIVAQARGGTANFFLWGGDDRINAYVSDYVAGRLQAEHGITLNRVGVADTSEVVTQVLSETEAGLGDSGSVDLVWINGENFRAMKEAGLLLCGWARTIPSAALIDWTEPAIALDFGTPVDDCEAPWSRAQFAMAYDSARIGEPPETIADLLDWIRANPGRFTYAAPPDFNGAVFVRHVFYHAAGGADGLAGPFDQALYDRVAPKAWEILNGLEPFLWREGSTYPADITALNGLYANGEVDFTFNYEPTAFGSGVEAGIYPPTTRSYAFADGTIANTSYVAIPANAANRAAAIVLANLLLDTQAQLRKADPSVWGMATVLDLERLPPESAAAFRALPRHPAVVSEEELAERAMPELAAQWIVAIEKGWIANVGR